MGVRKTRPCLFGRVVVYNKGKEGWTRAIKSKVGVPSKARKRVVEFRQNVKHSE